MSQKTTDSASSKKGRDTSLRRFTVTGSLVSKANSRRLVSARSIDGVVRPRVIKSEAALAWTEAALWQLKSQNRGRLPVTTPVHLIAEVYYSSRRPDLDVSLLMDVLQEAKVYENDRQVQKITATKRLDQGNPRVEVLLEPYLEQEL